MVCQQNKRPDIIQKLKSNLRPATNRIPKKTGARFIILPPETIVCFTLRPQSIGGLNVFDTLSE